LCRSNLMFYGNFWSKEDCHAANEQERRLAMTEIYEMYGRELFSSLNLSQVSPAIIHY